MDTTPRAARPGAPGDDADTEPHAMGGPSAPPPRWVVEGWARAKSRRDAREAAS